MGVPDIRQTDLFTGLDRDSREARKAASEAYKLRFLKPAVAAWEEQEWWALERAKDASKEWPYLGFVEGPRVWALELAGVADHPRFWHWYAAWVVARVSGRVPLGAVSDDRSVDALATCPSCGGARGRVRSSHQVWARQVHFCGRLSVLAAAVHDVPEWHVQGSDVNFVHADGQMRCAHQVQEGLFHPGGRHGVGRAHLLGLWDWLL